MDPREKGILCKKDRKFYYLETGAASTGRSVDRLRSVLIARGLITYHKTDLTDLSPSYRIMTVKEAQEKGVDIEVIYLNKHIKQQVEAKEEKPKVNPWNR